MSLLYIIGFVIVFFVIVWVVGIISASREHKKLQEARKEYTEIEKQYGYLEGREHCPHKYIEFSQTGITGVVTTTTKWCKVCGKHLGAARLKTSIFGNKWE